MADPPVGGRLAPLCRARNLLDRPACATPATGNWLARLHPGAKGARCTDGAHQIPMAPAEPGASLPATPFPGGFRTPAFGASGSVRAGPASETRHKTSHHPFDKDGVAALTIHQFLQTDHSAGSPQMACRQV